MSESTGKPAPRFRFVDGLRGLAALAVIVPHATGVFAFPSANGLSQFMIALGPFGAYGVEVFFVISGFAIAYSLRDTRRFGFGRFVLRRSVRLDPPYWAGLMLFGLAMALREVAAHRPLAPPGLGKLSAHLLYLQDILGYGQYNVAFWTLCLEFQLYLVFAVLIWISGSSPGAEPATDRDRRGMALIATFVVALAVSILVWPIRTRFGWFVPFFYLFLAGALGAWRTLGRISDKAHLACLGLMGLSVFGDAPVARMYGFVAAGAIYFGARGNGLNSWLSAPVFQWLGRISYSLYLVHVPVAVIVLGLRARFRPESNLVSFAAFVSVYVLALGVAQVFHKLIEEPCLRWSQRLRRP